MLKRGLSTILQTKCKTAICGTAKSQTEHHRSSRRTTTSLQEVKSQLQVTPQVIRWKIFCRILCKDHQLPLDVFCGFTFTSQSIPIQSQMLMGLRCEWDWNVNVNGIEM